MANPYQHEDDDGIDRINKMLDENIAKIRRLNDELRIHRRGGTVVVTPGIAGLGPSALNKIMEAVARFDSFSCENDPYGEHDCAIMRVAGTKIIWKVDYYDLARRYLSPDATDPAVTSRVMTIMRADEY